jgi:hypothetical protein
LSRLSQYLAELFVEKQIFQTKVVEKIKTHFFFSWHPAVYDKISKSVVEQERPQTIWRMRVACWIGKAARAQAHARAPAPTPTYMHALTRSRTQSHTHTHKYVTLTAFRGYRGHVNAPRCFVIRTLSCYYMCDIIV